VIIFSLTTNKTLDIYTVHISLNHVEESMAITDMYIERDWELITQANDKVKKRGRNRRKQRDKQVYD